MDGQIRVRLDDKNEEEKLVKKKSESTDHLHDDESVSHTGRVKPKRIQHDTFLDHLILLSLRKATKVIGVFISLGFIACWLVWAYTIYLALTPDQFAGGVDKHLINKTFPALVRATDSYCPLAYC